MSYSFLCIGVIGLMLIALVAVVVVSFLTTARPNDAERTLQRRVRALTEDFPEEVRARGGEEVLRNPERVVEWIRQLELGSDTRPADVRPSARRSELQTVLAAVLQRLAADHLQAAKRAQPPMVRIVIVALFAGFLFGSACGDVAYSLNLPGNDRFPHFWDFKKFDSTAYALGFATGISMCLALIALQAWLWRRKRNHLRQAAADRAKEIQADFSDMLPLWGSPVALNYVEPVQAIRQSLQSHPGLMDDKVPPEERARLRQSLRSGWLQQIQIGLREAELWQNPQWWLMVPTAIVFAYFFGQSFGEWIYGLNHPTAHQFPFFFSEDKVDLYAILAAFAMGIPLLFLFLAAQWLIWKWQRDRAQEAVQTSIRDFQGDFADQVRSWGGASVLRTSEAVQELLREQ